MAIASRCDLRSTTTKTALYQTCDLLLKPQPRDNKTEQLHSQNMSSLQDMVPELLDAITSHLDISSLAAMARCCRRFKASCVLALYTNVVLECVERCWCFVDTVIDYPELATLVQGFSFEIGNYWVDHHADKILPHLVNLRHLSVFAREQRFYGRGCDEDDDKVGLGLLWPGPEERVPSSVRRAASKINDWLPQLETCK